MKLYVKRIRLLRGMEGMSQKELARKSKVSQSTIAQIETEKIDPSVRTLEKIVKSLGTTISKLFAEDMSVDL